MKDKCDLCKKETDNLYGLIIDTEPRVVCRECYGIPDHPCGCDNCIDNHLRDREINRELLDQPMKVDDFYRDDNEAFEEVR